MSARLVVSLYYFRFYPMGESTNSPRHAALGLTETANAASAAKVEWFQHLPQLAPYRRRGDSTCSQSDVVRRSLLFSMHRTLRTVHVQDHVRVRQPATQTGRNPSTLHVFLETGSWCWCWRPVFQDHLAVRWTRIVGSSDNRSASLVRDDCTPHPEKAQLGADYDTLLQTFIRRLTPPPKKFDYYAH